MYINFHTFVVLPEIENKWGCDWNLRNLESESTFVFLNPNSGSGFLALNPILMCMLLRKGLGWNWNWN